MSANTLGLNFGIILSMDCQFCKIIIDKHERIVKETKFSFTMLSNPKLMDGHLLVIPKRHIEKPSELTAEERKDIFDEVINLQEKILEKISPGCDICEHYRPFIPDNKFKVSHLHFHLRPRFLDDELYKKVQIYEKDIFQDLRQNEWNKYREILSS